MSEVGTSLKSFIDFGFVTKVVKSDGAEVNCQHIDVCVYSSAAIKGTSMVKP